MKINTRRATLFSMTALAIAASHGAAANGPVSTGGVFDREVGEPLVFDAPKTGAVVPLLTNGSDTNEVVILLDTDQIGYLSQELSLGTIPNSAFKLEQAVTDVLSESNGNSSPENSADFFGNPSAIRPLLSVRLSEEDRATLDPNGPAARLEQYLVLQFDTVDQALSAAEDLKAKQGIAYAANMPVYYQSAAPTDPYYAIQSDTQRYQWGLHAMDFDSAWDISTGHGFISAIDRGTEVLRGPKPSPSGNRVGNPILDHCNYPTYVIHEDFDAGYHDVGGFRPQLSRPPECGTEAGLPNNLVDTTRPPLLDPGFQTNETHGTHVLGIMGAINNNGTGISGACPTCSTVVGHLPGPDTNQNTAQQNAVAGATSTLQLLTGKGMQVVNISFGRYDLPGDDGFNCAPVNGPSRIQPFCDALQDAEYRDVFISAASGNFSDLGPQFPASHSARFDSNPALVSDGFSNLLSVAGAEPPPPPVEPYMHQMKLNWAMWETEFQSHECQSAPYATTVDYDQNGTSDRQDAIDNSNDQGSCRSGQYDLGTSDAGREGVVAPAEQIVSTFIRNEAYLKKGNIGNVFYPYNATDAEFASTGQADESGPRNDGYGNLTGTSMAAPHVAGLAGIIRSINPLLKAREVAEAIRESGTLARVITDQTSRFGHGFVNAGIAVRTALRSNPSRLTPLFWFYSPERRDYFATTNVQMGTAAVSGTLAPANFYRRSSAYNPVGNTLSDINKFPSSVRTARADAFIFTTPEHPFDANSRLVPLYRLSWKCGDDSRNPAAVCSAAPNHVDTVHVTSKQLKFDLEHYVGYQLDGIEGYVFPVGAPQPAGTVKLLRRYNPARDDHALFVESRSAAMNQQGYTTNTNHELVGYVYPNTNGQKPAL